MNNWQNYYLTIPGGIRIANLSLSFPFVKIVLWLQKKDEFKSLEISKKLFRN
jgi:hypothetical protein